MDSTQWRKGFILALGFRLQFITAGNPHSRGLRMVTSHPQSSVERVKASMFVVIWLSTLISPQHKSHFQTDSSQIIHVGKTVPHRHFNRPTQFRELFIEILFQVILNWVKLSIKTISFSFILMKLALVKVHEVSHKHGCKKLK